MAYRDPLRHLSPLTEHPFASPLPSPAKSDASLSVLEAAAKVHRLESRSYGACRVLRAFLDNLCPDGKHALATDICTCKDNEQLIQLANHLVDAILKPFQLAGGTSPEPLDSPPSGGAHYAVGLATTVIETSTRADQAVLRRHCLRRDGHRCVCTGICEFAIVKDELIALADGEEPAFLDCAHIIPFAMGEFDDTDATQTRNKAVIWFAIHRYFPALAEKIDARSINQYADVMMLDTTVHRFFGSYCIAFKCEAGFKNQHSYRLEKLVPARIPTHENPIGDPIVFAMTSHDDAFPLPDPAFLATHRAVAHILQASGIGHKISQAMYDAELDVGCHVLDPSGRTDVGEMLSRMLLTSVNAESNDGKSEDTATGVSDAVAARVLQWQIYRGLKKQGSRQQAARYDDELSRATRPWHSPA